MIVCSFGVATTPPSTSSISGDTPPSLYSTGTLGFTIGKDGNEDDDDEEEEEDAEDEDEEEECASAW